MPKHEPRMLSSISFKCSSMHKGGADQTERWTIFQRCTVIAPREFWRAAVLRCYQQEERLLEARMYGTDVHAYILSCTYIEEAYSHTYMNMHTDANWELGCDGEQLHHHHEYTNTKYGIRIRRLTVVIVTHPHDRCRLPSVCVLILIQRYTYMLVLRFVLCWLLLLNAHL